MMFLLRNSKVPILFQNVFLFQEEKSAKIIGKNIKRTINTIIPSSGNNVNGSNNNNNVSIDHHLNPDTVASQPPKNARVVICGGGIMGAAVAYHLALAGWGQHTVVLEQTRYVFMLKYLKSL